MRRYKQFIDERKFAAIEIDAFTYGKLKSCFGTKIFAKTKTIWMTSILIFRIERSKCARSIRRKWIPILPIVYMNKNNLREMKFTYCVFSIEFEYFCLKYQSIIRWNSSWKIAKQYKGPCRRIGKILHR